MYLLDGFSIVLFMILIYLLSKIIIEKNAQSISMTKILGYSDREISSLYLLSTTIMVVVFLLLSFPIETVLMKALFVSVEHPVRLVAETRTRLAHRPGTNFCNSFLFTRHPPFKWDLHWLCLT